MRKPYPTDLSDAEWNYIKPYMPTPIGFGRPRTHDLREILNAGFYLLQSAASGAYCRMTSLKVAHRLLVLQQMAPRVGTWERVNRALRECLRVRLKRDP
jgi:putative transposase